MPTDQITVYTIEAQAGFFPVDTTHDDEATARNSKSFAVEKIDAPFSDGGFLIDDDGTKHGWAE